MFKSLFSCFKKQANTDLRDSYRRREPSMLDESEVVDIYGRDSIALRESKEINQSFQSKKSNEEIRIVAFGQIAEYFDRSKLPKGLPKDNYSRKVARIGLGVHHAVFLFYSYQIATVGKNDRGQLGVPISDKDSDNIYKDLQIIDIQKFKDERKRIIDVAAGAYHTILLTEPMDKEESKEGEVRQVYVMGDRNMLGRFESKDSSDPVLITIPRLEEDPSLRIKYIYSRNEK